MSTSDYDYNDTSTAYTGTVVDYDLEDRIVRINDMSLMNDPEVVNIYFWPSKLAKKNSLKNTRLRAHFL